MDRRKTLTALAALAAPPVLRAAGRRPPPASPEEPRRPVNALWSTRFDYKAPSDVRRIVNNAADVGYSDLFFQVRGNGTVFYRSAYEPWAYELSGSSPAFTGRNPGWDPLMTAVREGAKRGIRIHAYANVLPGWRGRREPPRESGQLWVRHRDWFMVDRLGDRMKPTSKWYTFLNPAHPGVRRHLIGVFAELAAYPVAGIHLDYIRFPEDYHLVAREIYPDAPQTELRARSDFSYDPVSLRLFGDRPAEAPGEWDRFRRAAVTRVVRDIAGAVRARRSDCLLSASLIGDPVRGYRDAFQNGIEWTRRGWLDWAVPMLYGTDGFAENLNGYTERLGPGLAARSLVGGLNAANPAPDVLRQIRSLRAAGCRGQAVFAYSHLFSGTRLTAKGRALFGG
ncbi:glycoside hydrolase family 10 protein [Kiritimatiella glycovorans]|uniref:Glycosyl hydrolase-like 10 domain-containing protein n=1 Tax=Kiritimatiella glycovorans TaxID=1307763 RepID=A0A0G3EF09_9BACT|nr:family 10 glycosylhydrolase [Kiritimatiella glycovorans]AKJ64017.1 hypothetical protein L21SP4_00749 [Kiritimatiella glycovorans]